jgi:hypothetical protein
MTVLDRLACAQHRRDEVPNQELARELVESQDKAGIQELVENLWNPDGEIQSDCVKTLYEIGYLSPALIADYASEFLKLLKSKNNRLVWGGMLALSTIAGIRADVLFPHWTTIQQAMEKGSTITKDAGVKTLAEIAAQKDEYRTQIFPYLLEHLATTRSKDIPQHAEKALAAVDTETKAAFIAVLDQRIGYLSDSQAARVRKVIRAAEKR